MKKLIWGKTIFESYKYLNRLIKSIDRLVLEQSVHSYTYSMGEVSTLGKMEAVIDLIQRKKRLLVVKMLVEESLKNIDRESARILIKLYIDKIDLKSVAISCNINKRTMARRINKMLIECMDKISDLGYSCIDIERLLENEGWIIGIYNYHVNKVISKSSKSNGIKPIEMSKLYGLDKMLFSQYSETHSTA